MYNDIIAGLTIAGHFSQPAILELFGILKRSNAKPVNVKLEMAMEQYGEDIDEAIALGEQRVFDHLAEARESVLIQIMIGVLWTFSLGSGLNSVGLYKSKKRW